MYSFARSSSGKVLGGVSKGIADTYGLNVGLVRLAFAAAALTQPLVVGVYLILWISAPSDLTVVELLRVIGSDATERRRFVAATETMFARFAIGQTSRRGMPRGFVALGFLCLAFSLQLSHVQGNAFSEFHPIMSSLLSTAEAAGSVIFLLAVALLFLLSARTGVSQTVMVRMPSPESLSLERGRTRAGGHDADPLSAPCRRRW